MKQPWFLNLKKEGLIKHGLKTYDFKINIMFKKIILTIVFSVLSKYGFQPMLITIL